MGGRCKVICGGSPEGRGLTNSDPVRALSSPCVSGKPVGIERDDSGRD